jgi:hypothetical protein
VIVMTTETKLAYLDGLPVSELLRRGWTQGLIEKLLGKPDQLTPNPHYRGGPKMRLYARARVLRAEVSADFRAMQEGREARKRVEQKANQAR